MIRKGCLKGRLNYPMGLIYRFRKVGHMHLTWSFALGEERSGNRVKKYFMTAHKIYGRETMFDIWGRGIHE